MSIEDGQVHHIRFTWDSFNGTYQFFKDGKQVDSGSGFQQGYTIKPGGSLVLGQDQDVLAGDFDVEETFVGELSQLNVWDKVLSRRVIVAQHNKCHIGKGSINWWVSLKILSMGECR